MSRESYKRLYLNEKGKKLQLEDEVERLKKRLMTQDNKIREQGKFIFKLRKRLKPWLN